MKRISVLAEKYQCAIILIGHMNKNSNGKSSYAISDLISKRTKQSSLFKETVTKAGYRSVDSFMRAFNKSHTIIEEYLKAQSGAENQYVSTLQMQQEKQSVLDKLHQYDEEAKRNKSSCKCREIVPKKGMEVE